MKHYIQKQRQYKKYIRNKTFGDKQRHRNNKKYI